MIVRFLSVVLVVFTGLRVSGAPAAEYVNTSPLYAPPATAPQIFATTFINQSHFEVHDYDLISPLPFQTRDTLNFRNEAAGAMIGTPGFRFDYFSGNVRQSMDSWINRGTFLIEDTNFFIISSTFVLANWLLVWSDSIINSGTISAIPNSLIRLEGDTVNLARGRIRTGTSPNELTTFFGGWLLNSNYVNDPGITDYWWGTGTNNVVRGNGALMGLDGFSFLDPNFVPPFVSSAQHEVISSLGTGTGLLFTNSVSLPFFGFGAYTAFAFTNRIGTNVTIQVVFLPTNSFDTNLVTDVSFAPGGAGGATAVVGFHTRDYDVVLDRYFTNSLFLLDALAFRTNVSLARNQLAPTRRPSTYELTRGQPFFFGSPANATYSPQMLYNPNHLSNAVSVVYAGYAGLVSSIDGPANLDPTNFPGRIEITANNLNLRESRIRAETTLSIKANNLTTNRQAQLSAPFMNLDLGTTQPTLVFSNLAPATVNRLSGEVVAWSAIWENTETNSTGADAIRFHVLVVDHSIRSSQPVVINQFATRGNDIVLHDFLNVRQRLSVTASSLDIKGSGGLVFPANANWANTNMGNLVNFTNNGLVSISGSAFVGTDRGYPYLNFINRGTNNAQVQSIWADFFENPGCMAALGGAFKLDAGRVQLRGRPAIVSSLVTTNFFLGTTGIVTVVTTNGFTNASAKITAASDLKIKANNISLSNAFLQAGTVVPGALILCGTNRLTDSGTAATNYLLASAGIQVLAQPKVLGDLLGTYALSRLATDSIGQHVWSGVDMGAVAAGFNNNLALGKLTLEGGLDSSFHFAGAKGKKAALYVDYLELLHHATNFNTALTIDPTLVIYFANANVQASKLDKTHDGRLRWVPSFTGPLSSTNLVYPSGQVYTFNAALVRDKDIDSDGDGTVNSKDPTPIFVGENVDLTVSQVPGRVKLSWSAAAGSQSHVEFKPSAIATSWQTLFTTNPSVGGRLHFSDSTSNRVQRVYRVRVDIPSP